MNIAEYETAGRAVGFAEDRNRRAADERCPQLRATCERMSVPMPSDTLLRFVAFQTRLVRARSAVLLSSTSLVEAQCLRSCLDPTGMLTIVDTSAAGAQLSRQALSAGQREPKARIRSVHTDARTYLTKLNAHDYDVLLVDGDASNYSAAMASADRLLRSGGLLFLVDAFNQSSLKGGLTNPADRTEKTVALRDALAALRDSDDFDSVLLPIGGGCALARRK